MLDLKRRSSKEWTKRKSYSLVILPHSKLQEGLLPLISDLLDLSPLICHRVLLYLQTSSRGDVVPSARHRAVSSPVILKILDTGDKLRTSYKLPVFNQI